MADPNLSELVTTTLRNRSKKIADNVLANNALLATLKKNGRVRLASGGRDIVEPLDYAENSTVVRYSGYDTLDISPSTVISAANYDWKQMAVAVSMSGLEQLQNSGKEALIDWLSARIENAENSLVNLFASDLYSDGTTSNQMGGLQAAIPDDPTTGTYGGINRATWSFWRPVMFDATTTGGAAATSSNIQGYMNTVYSQLVRGSDKPSLLVADNNYYNLFLASLQAIQRVTSDEMAQAGFDSVRYRGADEQNVPLAA